MWVVAFSVFSVLVALFLFYVKWAHGYWARKKVPFIEVNSIWGNMENPMVMKDGIRYSVKRVYDELKKRGHKHGGMYLFTTPLYIPIDQELIKKILVKDFQHFSSHGMPFNAEKEPLSAHLFNIEGEDWRYMRVKLTPTFTSGKMKMMFGTLLDCGGPMIEHVDNLVKNRKVLDVKEIISCYTTDVIGSCAFGLDCNSFKDPNAEFRRHGREVTEPSLSLLLMQISAFVAPWLNKFFHVRFTSKEMEAFFTDTIKNVMDYRKKTKMQRNDFVQLFMKMNEEAAANGEDGLTLNQIAAQAFVFFGAGFETSSSIMTFCLHELAFNQDVQDKLREEVRETLEKNDGKLRYDGIMDMKYMDQVLNETLRKYPLFSMMSRICTQEYNVPDTDVVIEKGTMVFVSTLGLQYDEEYYPNPEKFKPERFTEENKAKRPVCSFLPFGEGPRICIGLRFAMMQMKTGLSMLLNNYKISPVAGDPYKLSYDPKSFVLTKKGKVILRAEKLSS